MTRCVVKRHAVGAIQPRNLSQQLAVDRIYYHDASLPRDEEAVGSGINRHIIPATLTAELDLSCDMVAVTGACLGTGLAEHGNRPEAYQEQEAGEFEKSNGGHELSLMRQISGRIPKPWTLAIQRADRRASTALGLARNVAHGPDRE